FDRRKRRTAVRCVQWLVAVGLFLLTILGMLQLWHLYAAGLVMGVNQTVGFPTQQAFVGDLIPRRQLQEAVGMYSLVFNTCRAIGPALAGYIIAEWGAGTAFGGNVLASLPLIGCLVSLKGRITDACTPRKQRGAGRKASGLKAVFSSRSLLFIMISALIQNICGQSLYQIVPALMHGNPRNTGLILGAVGAGAMVSILFVLPFARKSDRVGAKLSSGTLWMGSALCVAGIIPVVEIQAVCFFFAGLATSSLFVTSSSAVQLLAPPERKSAILGLFSIVTIGVQPLAAMGWGAVVDAWGVSTTIIMAGGLEALFSVWMLGVPFWRNFRFSPEESPGTT
uniref:MFS transporter n=1 Tax=uncultured Akkermansia sp. TaxID=512294 RepID=UPI0025D204BC